MYKCIVRPKCGGPAKHLFFFFFYYYYYYHEMITFGTFCISPQKSAQKKVTLKDSDISACDPTVLSVSNVELNKHE